MCFENDEGKASFQIICNQSLKLWSASPLNSFLNSIWRSLADPCRDVICEPELAQPGLLVKDVIASLVCFEMIVLDRCSSEILFRRINTDEVTLIAVPESQPLYFF